MTAYADYNYYTVTYLAGKTAAVTAAEFPYYANQATALINQYTFGNINADDVPDEVKMCCCNLVDELHSMATSETAGKAGISSESVQGWSVFLESTEARKNAVKSAQKDIIKQWLYNTGLLYSGV